MQKRYSNTVRIFYPRFDREEIEERIRDGLDELKERLNLLLVVLFGSYAKGNYTVASDVDLLVVYDGEKREDAYALVRKTLDILGLEPHVYTRREYYQMKDTIERMTRGGVVIFRSKAFQV